MKTMQWAKVVVVLAPVALAMAMPGCAAETCPTDEDKAFAKEHGVPLTDPCQGDELSYEEKEIPNNIKMSTPLNTTEQYCMSKDCVRTDP